MGSPRLKKPALAACVAGIEIRSRKMAGISSSLRGFLAKNGKAQGEAQACMHDVARGGRACILASPEGRRRNRGPDGSGAVLTFHKPSFFTRR
jgi:hypothetical protein